MYSVGNPTSAKNLGWVISVIIIVYRGVRIKIEISSKTVCLGATRKAIELPNEGQMLSSSTSSFFLSLSYCLV